MVIKRIKERLQKRYEDIQNGRVHLSRSRIPRGRGESYSGVYAFQKGRFKVIDASPESILVEYHPKQRLKR